MLYFTGLWLLDRFEIQTWDWSRLKEFSKMFQNVFYKNSYIIFHICFIQVVVVVAVVVTWMIVMVEGHSGYIT